MCTETFKGFKHDSLENLIFNDILKSKRRTSEV